MNNLLGVSPSKRNQEPHEVKKKSFDLGGNRANDLRIRSTVTLPTTKSDRESRGLFCQIKQIQGSVTLDKLAVTLAQSQHSRLKLH